jgi:hypothetical protein
MVATISTIIGVQIPRFDLPRRHGALINLAKVRRAKARYDCVEPIDVIAGLTGQSSAPGRCLLDRPVEPGDDSKAVRQPERKTL